MRRVFYDRLTPKPAYRRTAARPSPTPGGAPRRALALCAVALLAFSVAACSSGGSTASSSETNGLGVEVASYDLAVGAPARFIAGVLTSAQQLVGYGTVDMRFEFLGTGQPTATSVTVGAPTTATFLPVPGTTVPSPPPSEPKIVSGVDRGVYATEFGFDRPGFWQVEVTARVNGEQRRGTGAFVVADRHHLPAPGDAALDTTNLTMASTDVPKAAVDSRAGTGGEVPDPGLHGTTIAAALAAKRPAVVVFSTPVYCASRFCGPVTDLVDGLSKTYADRASFIHVEIYRDFNAPNDADKLNTAAAEWLLRDDDLNEPWLYVIGADGRVIARFDNVVTAAELEPLIQSFPVIGPAA